MRESTAGPKSATEILRTDGLEARPAPGNRRVIYSPDRLSAGKRCGDVERSDRRGRKEERQRLSVSALRSMRVCRHFLSHFSDGGTRGLRQERLGKTLSFRAFVAHDRVSDSETL